MDCPKIPEIRYGEFSKPFYGNLDQQRIPIDGSIELTMRCNLNCVHCYRVPKRKELSTNQWKNIIDQIVEAGCLWLLITGGEPLIRSDFLDLYIYAKKKGLLIVIFTNGTLLTEEIVKAFAEYPPFCIEITIYGMSEKVYEKVTGVNNSHAKCYTGIDLLLKNNIPLKLKSVALTLNYHEIKEMKKFAEKNGVNFRFDPDINPRIDGSREPLNYRLAENEIIKLDKKDLKRKKEWERLCKNFRGTPPQKDKLFYCWAGKNMFAVGYNGDLYPCLLARTPGYNLIIDRFSEGWESYIPSIIESERKEKSLCQNCEWISICSICPSWSEWEGASIEQPVDFLCNLTKLRIEAFAEKVVK